LSNNKGNKRAFLSPVLCVLDLQGQANDHPVFFFEHRYVQLVRCLASLGYVVIALEHEDRSGCYATAPATAPLATTEHALPGSKGAPVLGAETVLSYLAPDDTPYSREKVRGFAVSFGLLRGVYIFALPSMSEGRGWIEFLFLPFFQLPGCTVSSTSLSLP
jgi:hypothetical protein